MYRQELEKGVQKIESMSSDLMWLLLKKEFFNTERDIYLCNYYIPPQTRITNESNPNNNPPLSPMDTLKQKVERYSAKGDILYLWETLIAEQD